MKYFNNVHILIYVLIGIIGMLVGKIIAWCNVRLPEKKKILSKEIFSNLPSNDWIFMIITATIYIFLLYKFGLNKEEIFNNLELLKYLILTPMLILTFVIDIKHRIIPNRLTLTMFEFGIIITFLYGISNINLVKEYLMSAVIGAGIFGLISLLGGLIAGKEAMGLGDVKFMGAVGLYFEINSIIEISILAFLVCAIISIIVLLIRMIFTKKKDDYIAFGPFLSLSCLICIFLPTGLVLDNFLEFCKMISSNLL